MGSDTLLLLWRVDGGALILFSQSERKLLKALVLLFAVVPSCAYDSSQLTSMCKRVLLLDNYNQFERSIIEYHLFVQKNVELKKVN